MNRHIFAAILFCLANSGLIWAGGVDHQEELNERYTFSQPQAGKTLEIDNIFGSIDIQTHNHDYVLAKVKKTVEARNQDRLERALAEVSLDVREIDNHLLFYVSGPFREQHRRHRDPGYQVTYDFTLFVPQKIALLVSTVNGGHVSVKGTHGHFELANVNGRIEARDMVGYGEAHTVNGTVLVDFAKVPDQACHLKTINGNITLQFPHRPDGDFRLKTFNGDMLTDFDYGTLPGSVPAKRVAGGMTRFEKDGFTLVRLGAGGPVHEMQTLNGDVIIRGR